MTNEELEYCLVVGAEEVDWLLCDAYRRWRLLRLAPPVEPFNKTARGMILSEGAGAILLSRTGSIIIAQIDAGTYYRKRTETEEILSRILSNLTQDEVDLVISSANGTFIDQAECRALRRILPDAIVYAAKPAVGALLALEPFIANLGDEDGKRYLKATLQVEFFGTRVPDEFTTRQAQVRDLLLTLFTSKQFAEIRTPQGKALLRDEIINRINRAISHDLVKAVYFTEFIVQ